MGLRLAKDRTCISHICLQLERTPCVHGLAIHTWSSSINSSGGSFGDCKCSGDGEHAKHAKEHGGCRARKLHDLEFDVMSGERRVEVLDSWSGEKGVLIGPQVVNVPTYIHKCPQLCSLTPRVALQVPHPLANNGPCRFSRHRPSSR